MAEEEKFDITDGRHRYAPCACCETTIGMGLVTNKSKVAVECMQCEHRGPEIDVSNGPSWKADKAAFEGWNAEPRGAERTAAPAAP